MSEALSPQRILYACRTLGVPDHDRCNGLAAPERRVLCLVWPRNTDYVWDAPNAARFEALQVGPGRATRWAGCGAAWRFWGAALRFRPEVALVYGYQDPVLLVLAFLLRARGTVVLSMNDSKFDDYGRRVVREALKALFLVPYQGILAATPRAADYARFLGKRRVELYACAIDTAAGGGGVAAGVPGDGVRGAVLSRRWRGSWRRRTIWRCSISTRAISRGRRGRGG